jgi:hypothetical protein
MGTNGSCTSLFARGMKRCVSHLGELTSLDENRLQSKREFVIKLLESILRRIDGPFRFSTSEKLIVIDLI